MLKMLFTAILKAIFVKIVIYGRVSKFKLLPYNLYLESHTVNLVTRTISAVDSIPPYIIFCLFLCIGRDMKIFPGEADFPLTYGTPEA